MDWGGISRGGGKRKRQGQKGGASIALYKSESRGLMKPKLLGSKTIEKMYPSMAPDASDKLPTSGSCEWNEIRGGGGGGGIGFWK